MYYMLLHNFTPHVVSVAFSFFRGEGGAGRGGGGGVSGGGGDETVFSRLEFALKIFKQSQLRITWFIYCTVLWKLSCYGNWV